MTTCDEQRLAQLLHQRRQQSSPDDNLTKCLDRDIVDIVYRHLYHALRPQMIARYGATVSGQRADTRFTELLNEFFVRVLDRFPDLVARTRIGPRPAKLCLPGDDQLDDRSLPASEARAVVTTTNCWAAWSTSVSST